VGKEVAKWRTPRAGKNLRLKKVLKLLGFLSFLDVIFLGF